MSRQIWQGAAIFEALLEDEDEESQGALRISRRMWPQGRRERSGARTCALVLSLAWSPSRRRRRREMMKAPKMD